MRSIGDDRGRKLAALAATISSLALAIAGCGSSHTSKQDVIARGNAICAATVRAIRATTPPGGGETSPRTLGAYLHRVLPIVEKEVSDLRALPRPTQDQALLNRYLAAVTSSGAEYRSLATAASRGNRNAVAQALAALQANPDESLAQRYGLGQCAGSTGTGVP